MKAVASTSKVSADDENGCQRYGTEHPELNMKIIRGEHGVKLLRPEEIVFTVEEDGRWKFFPRRKSNRYQAAIEAKRTINITLTTVIKRERKKAEKKSDVVTPLI